MSSRLLRVLAAFAILPLLVLSQEADTSRTNASQVDQSIIDQCRDYFTSLTQWEVEEVLTEDRQSGGRTDTNLYVESLRFQSTTNWDHRVVSPSRPQSEIMGTLGGGWSFLHDSWRQDRHLKIFSQSYIMPISLFHKRIFYLEQLKVNPDSLTRTNGTFAGMAVCKQDGTGTFTARCDPVSGSLQFLSFSFTNVVETISETFSFAPGKITCQRDSSGDWPEGVDFWAMDQTILPLKADSPRMNHEIFKISFDQLLQSKDTTHIGIITRYDGIHQYPLGPVPRSLKLTPLPPVKPALLLQP